MTREQGQQDGAATAATAHRGTGSPFPGDGREKAQDADPWQTALEGLDLLELRPEDCRLHGDAGGRLWGQVHGVDYGEIIVHMAFPLSDPGRWISVVAVDDADSDGRRSDGGKPDRVELGVLPSLDGCDTETRRSVEHSLHLRYFLPRILQIVSVEDEDPGHSGAVVWELLTDRGPMRMRMASLFEGITQLETGPRLVAAGDGNRPEVPAGRILFSDRDGNRADIPDVATMDAASRRLLERYYWF